MAKGLAAMAGGAEPMDDNTDDPQERKPADADRRPDELSERGDAAADGPQPALSAGRRQTLSPAAERALAEAEARRATAGTRTLPPERGGRDGPEPVRFGDWERRGIAVDF